MDYSGGFVVEDGMQSGGFIVEHTLQRGWGGGKTGGDFVEDLKT
jgi:hypothetical protein